MTFNDALGAQIREFDRQVADLREIMLRPNYDNDESPEVIRLKKDIIAIVGRTFLLKQVQSRAESIVESEAKKQYPLSQVECRP